MEVRRWNETIWMAKHAQNRIVVHIWFHLWDEIVWARVTHGRWPRQAHGHSNVKRTERDHTRLWTSKIVVNSERERGRGRAKECELREKCDILTPMNRAHENIDLHRSDESVIASSKQQDQRKCADANASPFMVAASKSKPWTRVHTRLKSTFSECGSQKLLRLLRAYFWNCSFQLKWRTFSCGSNTTGIENKVYTHNRANTFYSPFHFTEAAKTTAHSSRALAETRVEWGREGGNKLSELFHVCVFGFCEITN